MGRCCRPTETFWLASGLFWMMCISIEPLEKADMIQRIHESVSVVLNIMSAPKSLSDVSEIHWGQRIGYAKNEYRNTGLRRFLNHRSHWNPVSSSCLFPSDFSNTSLTWALFSQISEGWFVLINITLMWLLVWQQNMPELGLAFSDQSNPVAFALAPV